jgi:hypothetical protein
MKVTMPSDPSTQRCPGCAASIVPGALWCSLCLQPVPAVPAGPAVTAGPAAVFAPAGAPVVGPDGQFRTAAPKPAADLFSESRWRAGSVTFGPVGRIVLTFCVFVPYPLFLLNLPFGIVGVIVWSVIVPPALRDIWRRARHHHLPPSA